MWRVVLDPNEETHVCMYDANTAPRGVRVKFGGAWIPGQGHPAWGPTGDPNTQYNGGNKWGVLVTVHFAGQKVWEGHYRPTNGDWMDVPQNWGFPTSVAAVMNDDNLGDNYFPVGNTMMAWAEPL